MLRQTECRPWGGMSQTPLSLLQGDAYLKSTVILLACFTNSGGVDDWRKLLQVFDDYMVETKPHCMTVMHSI